MNRYLIPTAAAALLSAATFSFAATQHQANGTVKPFDSKAMTLSLSDGSTYSLPASFRDPGIKAGEKVNVAWEQQGSKRMADTVTIVK